MRTYTLSPEFWVTNASSMNVTLADLAINIKSFSTVNLLDKKHFSLTLDQLIKSKDSGSIFKKRDKILVRHLPPEIHKDNLPFLKDAAIPSRERSVFIINAVEYDELKIIEEKENQNKTDEEYAKEAAELIENDIHQPVNSKKL
jgi:hypothetical protein